MFMSGDNLHGKQPDIRYSVNIHDEDEWEKMSINEIIDECNDLGVDLADFEIDN